jgi:hypothetical protein
MHEKTLRNRSFVSKKMRSGATARGWAINQWFPKRRQNDGIIDGITKNIKQ